MGVPLLHFPREGAGALSENKQIQTFSCACRFSFLLPNYTTVFSPIPQVRLETKISHGELIGWDVGVPAGENWQAQKELSAQRRIPSPKSVFGKPVCQLSTVVLVQGHPGRLSGLHQREQQSAMGLLPSHSSWS